MNGADSNALLVTRTWTGVEGYDRLIAETHVPTGNTYYALADANKNITCYLTNAGAIAGHFEFSPFGQITRETGTLSDQFDFRFSSESFEQEADLVYYNFRYYSPELGRWMGRDLMKEFGGVLLYGYCYNAPFFWWDYLGMYPVASGVIHDTERFDPNSPYHNTPPDMPRERPRPPTPDDGITDLEKLALELAKGPKVNVDGLPSTDPRAGTPARTTLAGQRCDYSPSSVFLRTSGYATKNNVASVNYSYEVTGECDSPRNIQTFGSTCVRGAGAGGSQIIGVFGVTNHGQAKKGSGTKRAIYNTRVSAGFLFWRDGHEGSFFNVDIRYDYCDPKCVWQEGGIKLPNHIYFKSGTFDRAEHSDRRDH